MSYLCPMNKEKLKLFFEGRKGLLPKIAAACSKEKDIIWFHVASYGEFEEARPVIEATRARFPDRKILLTVFSPTVYIPMQNYEKVDWVFYLPLDTPWDVRRFLDAIQPSKAIFTLTDLWPVLLNALRRRKIDTYMMSLHMEETNYHFKWWDFMFRQLIRNCYKTVLVRDAETKRLLDRLGVKDVRVTGDPRMDRVATIAASEFSDPVVDAWCQGEKVFVAGSTYPIEDQMLLQLANSHPEDRFLIIPHEIEETSVNTLINGAQHGAIRYTSSRTDDPGISRAQILVVDTVGLLSRLYRYGFAAFVGAAFQDPTPHSVIEPAVYGLPVIFGPNYIKDTHCVSLIAQKAAFSVSNLEEFTKVYEQCRNNASFVQEAGQRAKAYCEASIGATDAIMDIIFG